MTVAGGGSQVNEVGERNLYSSPWVYSRYRWQFFFSAVWSDPRSVSSSLKSFASSIRRLLVAVFQSPQAHTNRRSFVCVTPAGRPHSFFSTWNIKQVLSALLNSQFPLSLWLQRQMVQEREARHLAANGLLIKKPTVQYLLSHNMTYLHLLWIENLDTAGVLHCLFWWHSAKEQIWCLLSKMYLMLQSLTWRMLVHFIIWKRRKKKKKRKSKPKALKISVETSIYHCWWWLKHHIPRSDDQSGPPSLCVITADRWPISIRPWSLDLPQWRQPAAEREREQRVCGKPR